MDALDLSVNKLAIAVSGGSDSLALCFLLDEWAKLKELEVTCLTIDHGLRSESAQEALLVGRILAQHNIKHVIIPWEGEKPKANLQEKARLARYELLAHYCLTHNISILATGHQSNDQAENFIIRAEHGSGVYGLAGIPEVSSFNQIKLIRPLLEFSREELQDFLKDRNIEWIEDPSNQNEKFARVRARKLLAKHPQWIPKLVDLTKKMAKARECIEYMVDKSSAELVQYFPDHALIEENGFKQLPQEIRFRLLAQVLQNIGGNEKQARGERIENLLEKIAQGFKASTLAGCLIKSRKNQLIITKEK